MKRKLFLLVLVYASGLNLFAQSTTKGFSQLSGPEKRWVFVHPFIAKKVFHCAKRARFVTDSLKNMQVLTDGNGGQLDAFRHAYWMALLVQYISAKNAIEVGKVHEKGNYRQYVKGQLEDSIRPDSMMGVMDLKNNEVGIKLGTKFKSDTAHTSISLEEQVLKAVKTGKCFVIKKDPAGNWLDKNGRMIDLSLYHNKWSIPKCLVRSDYQMVPVSESHN